MYGRRTSGGLKVPMGYASDQNPEGRPRERFSIIGTQDDPLGGRDRLGTHGMKGGYPSDNENVKESIQDTIKLAQLVALRNPDLQNVAKKKMIFEEKSSVDSLLDETNIKDLPN
jgi:hypothetical protein